MTIRTELIQILKDAATVDQVLKITGGKLTPQQRYLQSEKGKEARRRANANYAKKPKQIDNEAAKKYLQHLYNENQEVCKPLTQLWADYKEWAEQKPINRAEFKKQLALLNIPTTPSYFCPIDKKKVYRPAYNIDEETLKSLFD